MNKKKNIFNFWDLGILAIIGFYAYGVFMDLEGSWWRIYEIFASGIFFTFIVLKVNNFILIRRSHLQ